MMQETATSVKVSIVVRPFSFYDKWPNLRFYNNNVLLDDVSCNCTTQYDFFVNAIDSNNQITIELYNKNIGDNNQWDKDNNYELSVNIIDIKFDDVSIGHLLPSLDFVANWTPAQIKNESQEFLTQYKQFPANGRMDFNGTITCKYAIPVYRYLIEKKFKRPYRGDLAHFSNRTETFNYERGNAIVEEIKQILKDHE